METDLLVVVIRIWNSTILGCLLCVQGWSNMGMIGGLAHGGVYARRWCDQVVLDFPGLLDNGLTQSTLLMFLFAGSAAVHTRRDDADRLVQVGAVGN